MILEYRFTLNTLSKSESSLELHENINNPEFLKLNAKIDRYIKEYVYEAINNLSAKEIHELIKLTEEPEEEFEAYNNPAYMPGVCL